MGSLDFHEVVPNLVPKAVGLMCQAHSAFEVFDNSDQDLTQFIEIMVFHRCEQFLVPWPCSIEPELTWPGIRRPWSFRVVGYRVPPDTQISLKSQQVKCSLVMWHIAWLLSHAKLYNMRFCLLQTKCLGCKMLQSSSLAMWSLWQLRSRCWLYRNKTNAT
jgi:hypothetical protein